MNYLSLLPNFVKMKIIWKNGNKVTQVDVIIFLDIFLEIFLLTKQFC